MTIGVSGKLGSGEKISGISLERTRVSSPDVDTLGGDDRGHGNPEISFKPKPVDILVPSVVLDIAALFLKFESQFVPE